MIGVFYRFQSGFRPGNSTVYIVQEIYEALDEGSEMRAVLLDISKAFDRVWHRGLIYSQVKKHWSWVEFVKTAGL